MQRGKRGITDGGMNGFESALVSSSNFSEGVVEEIESPNVQCTLLQVEYLGMDCFGL